MLLDVPTQFVYFDLLLMITAGKERVKLGSTVVNLAHAPIQGTLFQCFARLPAFASSNLVGFHFKSVFFDASEDVQSPVIPHWRSRFNHVVWFRPKSG